MKIVIDIPEQLKKKIDNDFISSENFGNLIWYYALLIESIKDCVVLPEGHGRLIDAEALLNDLSRLCYDESSLADNPYIENPHIDAIVDAVEGMQTIIPADKEESEESE